jgi:hypothetical protein
MGTFINSEVALRLHNLIVYAAQARSALHHVVLICLLYNGGLAVLQVVIMPVYEMHFALDSRDKHSVTGVP